jgi:protein NrfD
MKTAEKLLWALGGIAFLAGLVGLYQRLVTGHTMAGYGSYVPWGLWVGLYTLMIGMSVGSFLLASLNLGFGIKRLEPIVAPALLIALATFVGGMLAVLIDLGHPLRAWRLFLDTGTSSVMGWMSWFYIVYFILLMVVIWFTIVKKQESAGFIRGLSILGAFLVIIFGGAEGALFGVVGAREFWHSGLTPVLFLAEGALSGVALVVIFSGLLGLLDDDLLHSLGSLLLGLLILSGLLELAEFFTGYYASIPAYTNSLKLVLYGPFWWAFWIIHIALGVVIPLALLLLSGNKRWSILLASALLALTALSTKLNLVITAQAVPEFEELRMAYTGPGLNFDYFPTTIEWLVSLWIVGLVALIALLGNRFFVAGSSPKAANVSIETEQSAVV